LEGGDATPIKRERCGDSPDDGLGGDTDSEGSGATEGTFVRGCRECDAMKDMCCWMKRTFIGRTEPHQGSGVRSPACRGMLVREVGKMDE